MEGAGTQSTWRGRELRPHGEGGNLVHMEGAATQFTLRTGQTACAASDPVSDLKLAEMYLKLPEIRVCPPELVMPKTCK